MNSTGRLRLHLATLSLAVGLSSWACGGGVQAAPSSGNGTTQGAPNAQLSSNPTAITFGSVAVGQTQTQSAVLAAANADVRISSASWNGSGFSLTGITFPVTIPAGTSLPYTIAYTPATSGSATGQVSFLSDAKNSPTTVTLAGSGAAAAHSVSLLWNASTSSVLGYNIYRATGSTAQYVKLTPSPIQSVSFTDSSVSSGSTYYYAATAVDQNNVESSYSNIATAQIP